MSYQGGSLTITRSTRSADAMHQVIFMQQRGLQSSGGDAVELFIVSSSDYQPQQLTFTSPVFLSFLRDHPEQTDVYAADVVRQLQAEPRLCPDPSVAWQVFSDLRKPDPVMARRIDELLPALNDPDYHVRNQTLIRLKQFGRDAVDVTRTWIACLHARAERAARPVPASVRAAFVQRGGPAAGRPDVPDGLPVFGRGRFGSSGQQSIAAHDLPTRPNST